MVFFMSRGLPSNKTYDPVFANNDWAAIIEACHANEVPDTWVADGSCYKDMDIGGKAYRIDIIGKNHDDLSDGTGKAPRGRLAGLPDEDADHARVESPASGGGSGGDKSS